MSLSKATAGKCGVARLLLSLCGVWSLVAGLILGSNAALAKDSAPVISGKPATNVLATGYYWFAPRATDRDRDRLTFRIQNKPSWATFDSRTGSLYGTPSRDSTGVYKSILIWVTDGRAWANLPAFNIKVIAPIDRTPALSMASATPPGSATVGQSYSFQPQVVSGNGKRIVFSMRNKPSWLTLDSSTGRLYGTPGKSNAGTYLRIVLSASDGDTTASSPAFSIVVANIHTQATRADSITLDWVPPSQNVDESSLTDLAGYRVYYGTKPGAWTGQIQVNNAGLTRYVLDNLAAGRWYFAVTAYNRQGRESSLSKPVSAVVVK